MAQDIMAIDIMNYPMHVLPELRKYTFNTWEWDIGRQSTFKTSFGRIPKENLAELTGLPNLEALIVQMDEAGFEKVFLCGMEQWSFANQGWVMPPVLEETKKLVDEGKGRVLGGVGYNPLRIEESLRSIDKAIKEYGFKYIYFHPQGFGIPPSDRRYFPAYVKAMEYDVPIGYQSGHSAEAMPSDPGNPMYIDELAIMFPSVKFLLSHTGWPWTDEWIDMVWKHPNVYGDISAYPAKGLPEKDKYVAFMNSWRGEDKVLFGSNGLGLKICKEQFLELPLTEERKSKIIRENAIKLFKL